MKCFLFCSVPVLQIHLGHAHMMYVVMYLCVAAGSGAAASSSRNLWVSGLSSTTRATDLKTLFSKYGKASPKAVIMNKNLH